MISHKNTISPKQLESNFLEVSTRHFEELILGTRKKANCSQQMHCEETTIHLPAGLGKRFLCKLMNSIGPRLGTANCFTQTPPGGAHNAVHAYDALGLVPHTVNYFICCKKCEQRIEGPDETLVQHAINHSNKKRFSCSRCGIEENERCRVASHRPICPFRGKKARIHDRISDDVVRESWSKVFIECFTEAREENFINGLSALI
ncbi:unnamed protein product, partial [Mesorhabditis belari]|uniref:C2H2-type domain-containing protein n=1 Tax=Mesorhabditis belari TaxID=2138241 RepID=A0AAF3J9B0_9BILA